MIDTTKPVVLIRPPAIEAFRFTTTSITPPLGLAYIAAALKNAYYNVHVLDAVAEGPTVRTRYFRGYCVGLRLRDIVSQIDIYAAAIGISVVFTHEWPVVAKLVALIKERFPETPVILGGEHVASLPEFCLEASPADYLVLGEGEEGVVELLNVLGVGKNPSDVAGIAYRDGTDIVVTPRRGRKTDVDDIPIPAWEMFRLDIYHQHRFV